MVWQWHQLFRSRDIEDQRILESDWEEAYLATNFKYYPPLMIFSMQKIEDVN